MKINTVLSDLRPIDMERAQLGIIVAGQHVLRTDNDYVILESGCSVPDDDTKDMRLIPVESAIFTYSKEKI